MATTIDPVPRRPGVFDLVLSGIRGLIDSGEVGPGERLPAERELAALLGVNRSSLREALRTLQAMGVVDIRHGLGVFVRPAATAPAGPGQPSPAVGGLAALVGDGVSDAEVLLDLVEMRRILEGSAAELAAARATPAATAPLVALVEELADAVAAGNATVDHDRRFHLAVARAAGNRVLAAVLELAYGATAGQFDDFFGAGGQALVTLDHHRRIVAAVAAGDAAAARAVMTEHLDQVTAAWAAHENEGESR